MKQKEAINLGSLEWLENKLKIIPVTQKNENNYIDILTKEEINLDNSDYKQISTFEACDRYLKDAPLASLFLNSIAHEFVTGDPNLLSTELVSKDINVPFKEIKGLSEIFNKAKQKQNKKLGDNEQQNDDSSRSVDERQQ